MTPAEWFDQDPMRVFAALHPEAGCGQWCARHWAPCPVLGANGIGAATELMKIWLDEFKPSGLGPRDVEQLGQALADDSPLCCLLGDERMYELWGRWPPA